MYSTRMVSQLNYGEKGEGKRLQMSQYSLSVLCHFVALAERIRSGYIGGQLVITHNISSFSFSTGIFILIVYPVKYSDLFNNYRVWNSCSSKAKVCLSNVHHNEVSLYLA